MYNNKIKCDLSHQTYFYARLRGFFRADDSLVDMDATPMPVPARFGRPNAFTVEMVPAIFGAVATNKDIYSNYNKILKLTKI